MLAQIIINYYCHKYHKDFPGGSDGRESAFNAGELSLIPGLGRPPGEGNGTPVFLPGKSRGQMSLEGNSPQRHKRVGQ